MNTAIDGSIILGSVVTNRCSPNVVGFKGRPLIVGSRARVCQSNGQWSGSNPYCIDSSKYETTRVQSYQLSTKATIIVIVVSLTAILVGLAIALVFCCHITQKCYQCFNSCFVFVQSRRKTTGPSIPTIVRPESQIDINEINASIEQLASFRPYSELTINTETNNNNNNAIRLSVK